MARLGMAYTMEDAIADLRAHSLDAPQKPSLPDPAFIDDYERRIGFSFPADYKQFLMEASDVFVGAITPLIITESGEGPDELSVVLQEARDVGVPAEWLLICEDNGDYYCLTKEGTIRFWSHDGTTEESWSDLAIWIRDVWIAGN